MLFLLDYRPSSFNEEILDAYASMLAVNRRLKLVKLGPPRDLFQPRLSALMETDGYWVSGLPLSAPMRYAFLSVIRYVSTASEPPRKRSCKTVVRTDFDLRGLDRVVVLLIFEFAAHGTDRKLEIKDPFSLPLQVPFIDVLE